MAAAQWPIETADLGDLILDPRNVRVRAGRGDGLTGPGHADAEQAIAKYMVEAEDLMTLITDILRDGYLDNEIPVVVREADGFVVLEGNRRVSALKVIADPGLIGTSLAHRVERLKVRYPNHDSPTTVRIMVAPSWDAAQALLARLHIGQSKKAWISEQQAIFFHAQLLDGVTVDDLRVRYPSEANKIPKKIRMGEMREVIRGLHYDDADLRDFVMNSDLKMTTFEYAYTPKKLHIALGLEFNRDGLLVSKHITEEQRRGLMYLLTRFRDKTLNTRSPELIAKYPEHDLLADFLRRIVAGEPAMREPSDEAAGSVERDGRGGRGTNHAGESNSGSGTAAGVGGSGHAGDRGSEGVGSSVSDKGSSADDLDKAHAGSRGRNRGDTKSRLDMDGFEYRGTSGGMRRRLEELKRLDVRDFPNASHDLLRTVLECAIKDYFKAKGRPMKPKQTIGHCVDELAKEFQSNAKITALINAINRKGRMSAEQFAGTTDSLSASNHEPDHFADGAEVHAAWDRIKPILIEIVGT